MNFFDLEIFREQIVLMLSAALAGYAAIFMAISMISPNRAWIYSLGVTLTALAIYWLQFDHSIHASGNQCGLVSTSLTVKFQNSRSPSDSIPFSTNESESRKSTLMKP